MLAYIGSAAGRPEELTETKIAKEVFGRHDYHPSEDNVVRAAARQLRLKIAEYFDGEGRHEKLILEIPKGGYQPIFRTLTRIEPELAPAAPTVLEPQAPAERTRPVAVWVLAVITCCSVGFAAAVWNGAIKTGGRAKPAESLMDVLFSSPPRRTTIVVADSAFVVLQSLNKQLLNLEEYADGHYIDDTSSRFDSPELKRMFEVLRTRQTTSIADLRITALISERYAGKPGDIVISHARNVRVRDFGTSDNFILLGSKLSNPWTSLFEGSLNFRFEKAPVRGVRIHNLKPNKGEEEWYEPRDPLREVGTDYAVISVQHNHGGPGRVMTISGTLMEGTEAAGDFALNPKNLVGVLKALGGGPVEQLPDFEVLLKTRAVGGAGRDATVVAVRAVQ